MYYVCSEVIVDVIVEINIVLSGENYVDLKC